MQSTLAIWRHSYFLKLALVAILVLIWDWMFWQQQYGLGNMGIYGGGLLLALVIARPAILKNKVGLVAAAATAVYCAAIFLHGSLLAFALFCTALSVAALSLYGAHLKDGWQWFIRLALHGLTSPFMPLMDASRVSKARKRAPGRKTDYAALFGLLTLPVLGGVAFFSLFVFANPVLEHFVTQVHVPALDASLFGRAIVWVILGVIIWSFLRPYHSRKSRAHHPKVTHTEFGFPSKASITLSLMVFNALFLMQNGMDIAFMSEIVPLPDDMTLAQYAHRGAYPLVATALLAGLFVIVLLQPKSAAASDKVARLLVSFWIAQNVVLVASSLVRTWDYIQAYSMTQLRLAALVWMVLVAFGLLLIGWRLLRAKSGAWLINANLAAVGIVLTGFCFVDMRTITAQWNVAHAKEVGGHGVELDLCHMHELGSGALLPLMHLEQQPLPETFRKRVKHVREVIHAKEYRWLTDGAWTWSLGTNLKAAREMALKLPPLDLGPQPRDCNGLVWGTPPPSSN